MNRLAYLRPPLAFLVLALLSACSGDVKETLGLSRVAPDEYRVVSRPPLSIPPDFELRPPLPGESNLPILPADKLARSVVTGEAPPTQNQLPTSSDKTPFASTKPAPDAQQASPGDQRFLSNAGATQVDPTIREKIFEDKTIDQKQEDAWYNTLRTTPVKKDEVVDPKKEADRLKQEKIPVKAGGPSSSPSPTPAPAPASSTPTPSPDAPVTVLPDPTSTPDTKAPAP